MDFTSDIGSDNGNGHSRHRLLDSSSSSSLGHGATDHSATHDVSSDPEMAMLSKEDRRQLKLQDTKERLLTERQKLLKEVELLKDELARTPDAREQTPVSDHEEESGEQELDGNAARTLVDLMALASKKSMFESDEEEAQPVRLDGNSGLQEELSSKYDTLPLLNIDLRLRYITQMTYPHASVSVNSSDDSGAQRTVSVSVLFNRNKESPIRLTFLAKYNTSDETLQEFSVSDIMPAGLNLTLRSFLQRHKGSPTAILFCLNEYDRLLHAREELLKTLQSKYGSWEIAPGNTSHYTDVERRLVLRSTGSHTLAIAVGVSVPAQESIPRTTISMHLDRVSRDTPDINSIFYGLVREYGVLGAAMHVTQSVLFP